MTYKFAKQVSIPFLSRTSFEPTSSPGLPYDIWRDVVELLPLSTLLNLCLVNRSFRLLTQPLVLKNIVIRPSGQLKSLAANFKHSIEFLRSPRVAGSIHHFHVDLSAFPHTKTVQLASDIVLGEFADIASSFPNLGRFTFVSVYINLPILVKLQRLAPFTLSLKSCIFASELTKTNLDIPISDLQFRDSSPFMEYATPRRRYPELFLRTEHLKSIMAGREYAETALIEMADYTRPFTQLTHLEFPFESCSSNHLIPVLSLCPNLEILNLKGRTGPTPLPHIPDHNTPFSASFLPKLNTFNGPLLFARRLFLSNQLLPPFSKRNIHTITIYLCRNFSLQADDKISLLSSAECETIFSTLDLLASTVTTLNFPALFHFGPEDLLNRITKATIGLTHLGINSDPRYYARCFRPEEFIQRLTPSSSSSSSSSSPTNLPNTLQTLTIGIQIKDPFRHKRGGSKEHTSKREAELLSQTTFNLIPSLHTLKVWYWAMPAPRWVTWVKRPSGRIDVFWESP